MAQNESDYEFYVGPATHLEGASLAIDGTARIDGKIVGKVAVKHLIVGHGGCVVGDISGETAEVEGTVEDSLQLSGNLPYAHPDVFAATLVDPSSAWKVRIGLRDFYRLGRWKPPHRRLRQT